MTAPAPFAVFGLSHVDVPVRDLERSRRFYEAAVGFCRKQSGEGWIDLDASSILIRLVETPKSERQAALRIQVGSVEPAYRALLEAGGCSIYAPSRTPDHEELASIRDPDGNILTIWRPLSEDEYGFLPDLPLETEWSAEAQALLKSLLVAVPALFRALARRKVVRLAEELYPRKRISPVDVVRAYILSSARITRYRLREPLQRHGFNPDDFQTEFETQ